MEKIRLNKFISDSGICSRREADKQIELGHVFVNGKRAMLGAHVSRHDKVLMSGNPILAKEGTDFVFIAFNKPVGIVSTTEIGVKDSIIDYIGYHERIFPIGRLDKDSQGLIFLTNNGDIVNKILRAGNKHEKEYVVTVNKPVTDDFILKMGNGVPILGETTKKCKVQKESVYSFRIILIQGLNRQIRRMCEYLDYEVVKLERIRIMNISLKGLPLGEWRQLEANEMEQIMMDIAHSSADSNIKNASSNTSSTTKSNKPSGANKSTKEPKPLARKSQPIADRATHPNPKSKELRSGTRDAGAKKQNYGNNGKTSGRGKSGHK